MHSKEGNKNEKKKNERPWVWSLLDKFKEKQGEKCGRSRGT